MYGLDFGKRKNWKIVNLLKHIQARRSFPKDDLDLMLQISDWLGLKLRLFFCSHVTPSFLNVSSLFTLYLLSDGLLFSPFSFSLWHLPCLWSLCLALIHYQKVKLSLHQTPIMEWINWNLWISWIVLLMENWLHLFKLGLRELYQLYSKAIWTIYLAKFL